MKIINFREINLDFEYNHFLNSNKFIDHLYLQTKNNAYYFLVDDALKNNKVISSFVMEENVIKFPPSGSFSYFEINEKKDQDNNKIIKYLELVKNFSKTHDINLSI